MLKRSNMTYRGHEKDDEIGQRKYIWRHTETKGRQTELMCLPVPICKVFNSPEISLRPPLSLYHLSSLPCLFLRYSHRGAHFHLWSCLACRIFLWALPRVPAKQSEHGEWDREEASGWGTDLYSRSHRRRRCTSSKAKIEEKSPPPEKKLSRGLTEGKMAQPCWFKATGDGAYIFIFVSAYAKMVKKKIKHKPLSLCVGGCEGGDTGEWSNPFQAQVALIKLALVFSQLCLQKREHTCPCFPTQLWMQTLLKGAEVDKCSCSFSHSTL